MNIWKAYGYDEFTGEEVFVHYLPEAPQLGLDIEGYTVIEVVEMDSNDNTCTLMVRR